MPTQLDKEVVEFLQGMTVLGCWNGDIQHVHSRYALWQAWGGASHLYSDWWEMLYDGCCAVGYVELIEALYTLPVSEGAAYSDMELYNLLPTLYPHKHIAEVVRKRAKEWQLPSYRELIWHKEKADWIGWSTIGNDFVKRSLYGDFLRRYVYWLSLLDKDTQEEYQLLADVYSERFLTELFKED